jgi:hypothetical protein
MAERIAEAYVQIIPTTTGIAAAISSEMGGAGAISGEALGAGMLGSLKKFAGPIAAAIGIAAIGSYVKDSIGAASDLAEAGSAVGEIFGTSFGKIDSFAKGASTALGQSQLEALNAAKTFGIFGNAAGLSGDDLAGFATGLATTASDLASFNNTSPEEAIVAIGAALRGEAEPIRKYGILLDDWSLRNKALSLGLIMTTKEALTPQQKILAAQALIYEQTGAAAGDFERTSGGLANQQRIMAAQFTNLSASIGQAFLPAVTGLASFMNTTVIPVFQWMVDNPQIIIPVLAGIGTVILVTLIPAFIALMPVLWGAVTAQLALTAAWIASPIGMISLAIGALIGVIIYLANETTFFQDTWQIMVDAISMAWTWLWETVLKPIFDFIGAAFKFLWDYIINPIITAWLIGFALLAMAAEWLWDNAIKPALKAIGGAFEVLWLNVIKPVVDFIVKAFHVVADTAVAVFSGLGEIVGKAFESIIDFIKPPVNFIIDMINKVINGLNSIKIDVPDWVPEFGGQTIGFNIPRIPKLAKGGTLTSGGSVMVGEKGAEILTLPRGATVTPLDRAGGQTIIYNAAPNATLDGEQELLSAMRRAKVVAGW